jgi:hypothetical protein
MVFSSQELGKRKEIKKKRREGTQSLDIELEVSVLVSWL